MNDSMVTARMAPEKKRAGSAVLGRAGLTASQAINQLYDYLIQRGSVPFDQDASGRDRNDSYQTALDWLDSIPTLPADNEFSQMTDQEIHAARLASKGLM